MRKALYILPLLLILPVVFAQYDAGIAQEALSACNDLFFKDAPTSDANCKDFRGFFYFFIIPLVGTWLIFSSFIMQLRIFGDGKTVPIILGFLSGMAMFYTGATAFLVAQLFQTMGVWTVGLFAFLVISGSTMLVMNKFTRISGGLLGGKQMISKQIEREMKYLDELKANLKATGNLEYEALINRKEQDIRGLEAREAFFDHQALSKMTPRAKAVVLTLYAVTAVTFGVLSIVMIGPLVTIFFGKDAGFAHTALWILAIGIAIGYFSLKAWQMHKGRTGGSGSVSKWGIDSL